MSTGEMLVTFSDFSPLHQRPEDIYLLGASADGKKPGVIPEMSSSFSHALAEQPTVRNLGGLIRAVGPAKELQLNIGAVQAKLGTSDSVLDIARGWSTRTDLLSPVERSYMDAALPFLPPENEAASTQKRTIAVATGGIRNWMVRRATVISGLARSRDIDRVLLAAGNREMQLEEGPDVVAGMTEADYMEAVVSPQLGKIGLRTEVLRVESGAGDDVMRATARAIDEKVDDLAVARIVLASNAGAWVQNAGQLRRAMLGERAGFDYDGTGLFVAADGFKLGATGNEPRTTHQNPFTALGVIARGVQELARHIPVQH